MITKTFILYIALMWHDGDYTLVSEEFATEALCETAARYHEGRIAQVANPRVAASGVWCQVYPEEGVWRF